MNDPDTGGKVLANAVVSAGSRQRLPGREHRTTRCAVSVPVIAGALTITAPISADLGATTPGGSASASLGTVQVIDNRGFGADWTATVSATEFTTGNGTGPETIPASDAYYDITGFGSTTGSATFSTAAPARFCPATRSPSSPPPTWAA